MDLPELITEAAPALLYTIAFVAAFGESAPAIGLLVPGQTLIVGAAFLAGQGIISPWMLLPFVAAGGLLGDAAGYYLGRHYGLGFMARRKGKLRLTPERMAKLQGFYDAHGAKAVILGRFQPITRAFGPYIAGAAGMGLGRFGPAAVAAAIVAACALVGLGYIMGIGFEFLGKVLGLTLAGVVTVALTVIVLLYWRSTQRKASTE